MNALADREGPENAAGLPRGTIVPCSKIWLERGGKVVLSDWRVELLEEIERTGSLARAVAKMEVPYRTAWYKLKEVEDQLGVRLLETRSGGAEGGHSSLTTEGRQVIARFRRLQAGVTELVRQRFQTEFGDWPW